MDKAEQPTARAGYTVADYELAEQCVSAANVVTCDGYYEVDIEKVAETLARHRTTSLAAQDDVTLVEELRAEISNLEAALTQIAGSHWERYGIGQTDIEDVPDLSAEEAMNVARDALSNTPAPSPPAQDGLVEAGMSQYLKDGQTPLERMEQDQADILGLMKLLQKEKELTEKLRWALSDAVTTNTESCRERDAALHRIEAARLGIIEGRRQAFEEALEALNDDEVAEAMDCNKVEKYAVHKSAIKLAKEAIRALIEEQKV